MDRYRVVFFGTAEIATHSLRSLANSKWFQVVAVVSQPDRPAGRDLKLQPTPVKAAALELNLPVLQPERARAEEFFAELRQLAPDICVVMAYGQILPQSLLDIPKYGCVNIHTSILPKYRGAAPIQWAILNGDSETGVTLMKMDAGMDTGWILAKAQTPITRDDDAQTLHDRLGRMAAEPGFIENIVGYIQEDLQPVPQLEGATHARKITKEDGRLRWTDPAPALWNRVRGLVPWPGAFTIVPAEPKPHILKIWRAEPIDRSGPPGEVLEASKDSLIVACGTGALRLLELQREGGKRLPTREFLGGFPLRPGQRLE